MKDLFLQKKIHTLGLNCYRYVFFSRSGFTEAETDKVGHIDLTQIYR